ncbi:uncharacterized protein K489DRAFT_215061 [Dissoconium aciculare CBS 342.82]|uniref:Uncharacterized protein n=1 Tax=Dissoconium aciculare CBS 342.82 TaxID=1314786 RepID=A0A6J3M490_9PEZI|nr:uncharacterized protein K489DRAFT_215061 [Dissoconium aciculare CBS 342.82]KAF1822718.1 hypothetical protein K489DRAFT_215061 [Dissoconium aciculare CBS 342.82]
MGRLCVRSRSGISDLVTWDVTCPSNHARIPSLSDASKWPSDHIDREPHKHLELMCGVSNAMGEMCDVKTRRWSCGWWKWVRCGAVRLSLGAWLWLWLLLLHAGRA